MRSSVADNPAVDYTSRDYEGFKASLLDYAARAFPQWVPSSEGDFGVLLVELFAYLGDSLSYYGDRLQQESFLPTATQRLSLLQIADLLGYQPSNGVPSTGTVTFQTSNPGPPSRSLRAPRSSPTTSTPSTHRSPSRPTRPSPFPRTEARPPSL